MVLAGDKCLSVLRELNRWFVKNGVPTTFDDNERRLATIMDGDLFKLMIVARCRDKRKATLMGVVQGFGEWFVKRDPRTKAMIAEELLSIPARINVAIGLDSDRDITIEPWATAISDADTDTLTASILLIIMFAKWVEEQVQRIEAGQPLRSFDPEEELKRQRER